MMFSSVKDVQFCGGGQLLWGIPSYIRVFSVLCSDTISTLKGHDSTVEDVSVQGYYQYCGRYHHFCWVVPKVLMVSLQITGYPANIFYSKTQTSHRLMTPNRNSSPNPKRSSEYGFQTSWTRNWWLIHSFFSKEHYENSTLLRTSTSLLSAIWDWAILFWYVTETSESGERGQRNGGNRRR